MNIAKVLRNKEGHVATPRHRYDKDSYRAMEAALKGLYREIFGADLTIKVSFLRGEKSLWHLRGPK
ncbi:MAG: hypothetical protein ACK59M_00225 [Pseudomonadota bacterium]